jgi:hypothetical protein
MRFLARHVIGVAFAGALVFIAPEDASAIILFPQSQTFSGSNDCPGDFFGPNPSDPTKSNGKPLYTGFSECWVQQTIAEQTTYYSPSIIKFEWGPGLDPSKPGDISTRYPSVTGSEFHDFAAVSNGQSGSWQYTPGDDDPSIMYWAAKAGNGFTLFWMTESDDGGLADAVAVTAGEWTTPGQQTLSHLTFYDSGGGGPPSEIPEPGTLLLIGSALAALGLRRRLRG